MAGDIRESFPTLEDGSGEGAVLSKSLEGDASAGKVGSTQFVAKDSAGNLILLTLDEFGRLKVSSESGVSKKARGELLGGAASGTLTTVATLALTVDKIYDDVEARMLCRRGAYGRLIWNDNGAETILGDFIVDAGQYVDEMDLNNISVTAGSTGTQELIIKAYNFDAQSAIRGAITALEL